MKSKRGSISGMPYSPNYNGYTSPRLQQRSQFYSNYQPVLLNDPNPTLPSDRFSYFMSPMPLNCLQWAQRGDYECIALSTYKEGFTNKIQIVHGSGYRSEGDEDEKDRMNSDTKTSGDTRLNSGDTRHSGDTRTAHRATTTRSAFDGFDFMLAADVNVEYPVTQLQWDPRIAHESTARLAALLEVLRLFAITDNDGEPRLEQTHTLANPAPNTGGNTSLENVNTLPPVTSFDWNSTDPSIIITSSVDTTCTLWDVNRAHGDSKSGLDVASVKTQLIAHDSEVFDVKFIHNSTNVFASVGNDGSMRVFDLRSLEHSTIIYEPGPALLTNTGPGPGSSSPLARGSTPSQQLPLTSSNALLRLSASNIDQHHLATIGANSNNVIIIDMRMPGLPLATLDASLGATNSGAINCLTWHPTANYLLTGGDDCQALIWDCSNLQAPKAGLMETAATDTPVLSYEEDLEVNSVCWRSLGEWFGVVSGKGFQAVLIG